MIYSVPRSLTVSGHRPEAESREIRALRAPLPLQFNRPPTFNPGKSQDRIAGGRTEIQGEVCALAATIFLRHETLSHCDLPEPSVESKQAASRCEELVAI